MLHELSNISEGVVIKRPSQHIKSPYVADVIIDGANYLGHTPALGCCGLADAHSTVYMTPSTTKTSKCNFTFYLAKYCDIHHPTQSELVGINPKTAELLVERCIQNNYLSFLQSVRSYCRETSVVIPEHDLHSRFDFSGIDCNGQPFLMEIKSVPLANYEDLPGKERLIQKCYRDRDFNSKIAYFPDGYRKKQGDTISPRALKHVRELTKIAGMSRTRCILGFVIQRSDVSCFQASVIDPEYKNALKEAKDSGVEIFALVVKWTSDGKCSFVRDDLPIHW